MKSRSKPSRARSSAKQKQKAKHRAAPKRLAARSKPGRRGDFGAPIEGFFEKQPTHLRQILDALRKLVEQAAPDAKSSIKWGMPFYAVGGVMFCALGAHKSHVNLVIAGPPKAFVDPEGRLSGGGKTGRHLKLRALDELPTTSVRGWLRTAAELARKKSRI